MLDTKHEAISFVRKEKRADTNEQNKENMSFNDTEEEKPKTAGASSVLLKKEINISESPLLQQVDLSKEMEASTEQKRLENERKIALNLKQCEQQKERLALNKLKNFKLLLDDLILSCSPFLNYKMPYLLTENPNDFIRVYLPSSFMKVYLESTILLNDGLSPNVNSHHKMKELLKATNLSDASLLTKNQHDFLKLHLTKSLTDSEIRKFYADYKSRGGIASLNACRRLMLAGEPDETSLNELKNLEKIDNEDEIESPNFSTKAHHQQHPQIHTQVVAQQQLAQQKPTKPAIVYNDCLDIVNRQHLAVLFYSQSETSPVYPNICQRPRIIKMNFYTENDMTLGSFLARNCFRNGYKCNNDLCDTLIVYHTRS